MTLAPDTQDPATDPPKVVNGEYQDEFIMLVKEIENAPFFFALNLNNRLLTFEMLAAAETRNLGALFDKLGYIVLLSYIDVLPEDYQHRFVDYSVDHLKSEGYTILEQLLEDK